jgi:pilus assembly protein CpaF
LGAKVRCVPGEIAQQKIRRFAFVTWRQSSKTHELHHLKEIRIDMNPLGEKEGQSVPAANKPPGAEAAAKPSTKTWTSAGVDVENFIRDEVFKRVDPLTATRIARQTLMESVTALVGDIANERRILLNQREQRALGASIVDEMVGFGPIDSLVRDTSIADILVNGPNMIYVEQRGKLVLTGLKFRSDAHVLHVAQRIASSVGRRIDESSPILDARLPDGSRVNVIIPPSSLSGPCISIRKFSQSMMDFPAFVAGGTMSASVARALEIAARCRLNIIVSGGTGSGKTTLLNSLSKMIDPGERIITIEDAAELQLQQIHVIRLESRPPNIEGHGEITQRELLRNALRMRPDRIIVGEVRGAEAFDMMQAMNTGHSGSMSTIHANSSRDALSRIENMILMETGNLPMRAIRSQIASALDLVIQTERMRDGVRRVTEVMEVSGIEEESITLKTLFLFRYEGENPDGSLRGAFEATKVQPRFLPRLSYFGLADAFLQTLGISEENK